MQLRTQYILFIVLIHLVTIVMSFIIFQENKLIFIASEVVILLSLFFSIRLYNSLVQPLRLMLEGIEAIKSRDFNIKFLETGKFEMDRLIHVYNQMIDELRQERRMQAEQHYFLEKLIHSSPTGIIILDFDGNITRMNPKAKQWLGIQREAVAHQALQALEHPLAKRIAQLPVNQAEIIAINGIETYKCQRSHFIDRGFPRHFILIEELTTEILQTEKKAYGKVIRMMAHEVNNSIGPINSILEALLFYQNQLNEADRVDFVNVLEVAMQRNQRLNQFMQNFAAVVRLPLPEKTPSDLCALVQNTATLLQAEAERRGIQLTVQVPPHPVIVALDVQQMEQVLVNIVKNAFEALVQKGRVQFLLDAKAKKLLIRNDGAHIDTEVEGKLFSPFFSTKKDGQGIGLMIIREVLLHHGFIFSLKTEADGWTVFKIEF